MRIKTNTVSTRRTWLLLDSLLVFISFIFIGIAMVSADDRYILLFFSWLPLILVINTQILSRSTDLFSPLSFVLLTSFLGITVQTFYLLFHENGENAFQLYGYNKEIIQNGLIAINIGLLFLALGYLLKVPKVKLPNLRIFRKEKWSRRSLSIVLLLCILIGLVSVTSYLKELSILADFVSQFSVKRRVTLESGQTAVYAYLRWGAQLFQIAFILYFSFRLTKKSFNYPSIIILTFLAILSISLPFISSSRADILYFIITILMLKHYLIEPISIKNMMVFISVALLIITFMGALRYVQQRGLDSDAYGERIGLSIVYETVADSGNFLGVGKTSVIVNSVPDKYDYQFGRTFFLWVIAPIPRTLWDEKPIISIGGELGHKIFNTSKNTGIPPGFIGELYINFGWIGIPFGMFILGAWLKFLYINLLMRSGQNKNIIIIYISIILPFSLMLLNSNFSGVMIRVLQTFIPLVFFLTFITRK